MTLALTVESVTPVNLVGMQPETSYGAGSAPRTIIVPMDTILRIEQRPAPRSTRLNRHHVQLGDFLFAVRAGDRLQDRLRDAPVEPAELVVPNAAPLWNSPAL